MDILLYILLFFHILGAAAIVGGWFATFRRPGVSAFQFHGAWVQLVTGLLMVGILEMSADESVNNIKIGVKLIISIVVLIAAIIGYRRQRRGEAVSTGLAHAVGGLALINIGVATLWH